MGTAAVACVGTAGAQNKENPLEATRCIRGCAGSGKSRWKANSADGSPTPAGRAHSRGSGLGTSLLTSTPSVGVPLTSASRGGASDNDHVPAQGFDSLAQGVDSQAQGVDSIAQGVMRLVVVSPAGSPRVRVGDQRYAHRRLG
eukprot:1325648-Pyramimonas_sp.AAC.1